MTLVDDYRFGVASALLTGGITLECDKHPGESTILFPQAVQECIAQTVEEQE